MKFLKRTIFLFIAFLLPTMLFSRSINIGSKEQIYWDKKKNVIDLKNQKINKNIQINTVAKTSNISLIGVNDDDWIYYVLNNSTGDYFIQWEMTDLGIPFESIGFDEENNAFHLQASNKNYWYLINENELINNDNNYKYDINVTFSITRNPNNLNDIEENKKKFYLKANYSNGTSGTYIYLNKYSRKNTPTIEKVEFYGSSDNLFKITINEEGKQHYYFFDANTNTWPLNFDMDNSFCVKKENYFFYKNYFNYSFSSDEKYFYNKLYNFWNGGEEYNVWKETIDNKSVFLTKQNYLVFVDFHNFLSLPTFYKTKLKIDNLNPENQILQSDDGGFYFLATDYPLILYKFNFQEKNNIEVINDNTKKIYVANEHFFVTLNKDDELVIGSKYSQYQISIKAEITVNSFIENNCVYLDKRNFVLDINNKEISSVKLNNKIYPSDEENSHHWEINIFNEEFKEITNFVLTIKTKLEQEINFKFQIMEDYLPQINVSDLISENKIQHYVFKEENESIIDGYENESNVVVNINDFVVKEATINSNHILLNTNYILNNTTLKNEINIVDKFGKKWNETIFISNDDLNLKKYWYETNEGINNAKKLKAMNYSDDDIKELNAIQTNKLIPFLEETFNLSNIDPLKSNFVFLEVLKEIGKDVEKWYRSKIPIDRISLNDKKDKYSDPKEKSLEEIVKQSFVSSFNKTYQTKFTVDDFLFSFKNENDFIKNNNDIVQVNSNSLKVIGELSFNWNYYCMEWIDLRTFVDENISFKSFKTILQENFNYYFQNLTKNKKRKYSFRKIKQTMKEITVSSINEYVDSDEYKQFYSQDFNNEIAKINLNDIKIKFQGISEKTLIKNIKTFSITLEGSKNSLLTNSVEIDDLSNPIYGFKDYLTPILIVSVIFLLIIFIIVFIFLIKRKKQKEEFLIKEEFNDEL